MIGEILQGLRSQLEAPNQDQNTWWTVNHCPFASDGCLHPHKLHSTTFSNQDIIKMTNLIVDLLVIGFSAATDKSSELLAVVDHTSRGSYDKLKEKINSLKKRSIKASDFEAWNTKMYNVLERLGERLPATPSSSASKESSSNAIASLIDQVKSLEMIQRQTSGQIKDLATMVKGMNPGLIQEALTRANQNHINEVSQELQKLHGTLREAIAEIKFDPDNPKPTELRTEENSRSILKINEELLPLVKEVKDTLTQTMSVLDKVSLWLR